MKNPAFRHHTRPSSTRLRLVGNAEPTSNDAPPAAPLDDRWIRPPGGWADYAACRDLPTELFFPDGTDAEAMRQTAVAKRICASCPVRRQCLDYALATAEPCGIFGGTTEEERQAHGRLILVENPG